MLHLIMYFFFPQESSDIREEKGRLDFNDRGNGHMELHSNVNVFIKKNYLYLGLSQTIKKSQ